MLSRSTLILHLHCHAILVSSLIFHTNVQRSKRWRYPSLYYNMVEAFTDETGTRRTVQLVVIDTVVLTGNNDHNPNRFMQPPGPANASQAEDQWQVRA